MTLLKTASWDSRSGELTAQIDAPVAQLAAIEPHPHVRLPLLKFEQRKKVVDAPHTA